jgi:hypothetical protein
MAIIQPMATVVHETVGIPLRPLLDEVLNNPWVLVLGPGALHPTELTDLGCYFVGRA